MMETQKKNAELMRKKKRNFEEDYTKKPKNIRNKEIDEDFLSE